MNGWLQARLRSTGERSAVPVEADRSQGDDPREEVGLDALQGGGESFVLIGSTSGTELTSRRSNDRAQRRRRGRPGARVWPPGRLNDSGQAGDGSK